MENTQNKILNRTSMAEIVVLHFIISNRFVSLFSLKSTLQYEIKGQIKTHSKKKD